MSQTSQSTVEYPRPVNIGLIGLDLLSEENRPLQLAALEYKSQWSVFLVVKAFETTEGVRSTLDDLSDGGSFRSSKGKSLLVYHLKVVGDPNSGIMVSNQGYTKVAGPEEVLKPGYTDKEWDRVQFPGIQINGVFGAYISDSNNKQILTIIYGGTLKKYGISHTWAMVFEHIPVTEVL